MSLRKSQTFPSYHYWFGKIKNLNLFKPAVFIKVIKACRTPWRLMRNTQFNLVREWLKCKQVWKKCYDLQRIYSWTFLRKPMKLNDARAAVKHTVLIYKRIDGNSTRYETTWPSYNNVNEFIDWNGVWKICLSCVSYQIWPHTNRKTEEALSTRTLK